MAYQKTGPTPPSCAMTGRNKNPGGNKHSLPRTSHGPRPTYDVTSNTKFQVRHQDEPTTANPVSQHKNFAGMEHGLGKAGKTGSIRKPQ